LPRAATAASDSFLLASPSFVKHANMLDAVRGSHFLARFSVLWTKQLGPYLAVVQGGISTTGEKCAQQDDAEDSNFHRSAS
jgi:hypothetical protein